MGIMRKIAEEHPKLVSIGLYLLNRIPFNNRFTIKGKDNRIVYSNVLMWKNRITISGDNNCVFFGKYNRVFNSTISIRGNNNIIFFDEMIFIKNGDLWMENEGSKIIVGKNTTFADVVHLIALEGSSILVGEDCLFAADVFLRTGDSHSVLDAETKKRINFAEDIRIGNHCWIAYGVHILKGVVIPDNVVIATKAVVTKSIKNGNVILGGFPASIIKENINWSRDLN